MLSCLSRSLRVLAVAFFVIASSGCAQERAPINKVQANALDKHFFVGNPNDPNDDPVFYWRNFVVDASEDQELIGIGSWSGVDRIKWEISENTLFARRAYDQNAGADNKGSTSGYPNGTIVAAYPISSHFDIKRAYNPQTGEELNIVEENTTDRPWYQRDYFRVDWSTNQVDTPLWSDMFIGKAFGDIKLTPVSYYVSDPDQDDAPHFEPASGYFDVTSKFLVEPVSSNTDTSNTSGVNIPLCAYLGLYTGTAIYNCDAQEAVVRSSYWRVDQLDPDGDFEPFENTRANLDVIGNPGGLGDSFTAGIITPPRVTYDPGYGYVDPNLTRLMNVHNIWKKSHQTKGKCKADADCAGVGAGSECLPSGVCTVPCNYGARKDGNANGTDDQCENKDTGYQGSQGSQCSFNNRCTIPYRDRETSQVAWWVNTDMPDTLLDTVDAKGKFVSPGATEDIVYTWNQAVDLAVNHAREVECRRTAGDRSTCHAAYFDTTNPIEMLSYGGYGVERVKKPENILVTCHNPVRDYDPEVCGGAGTRARVGDVRRNFIFYWPYSSRAPWGGIANWNADPLTGQIVGASATVMARSVTAAAAQIRDIILVANNELDMTDITSGVPAQLYQHVLRTGQTPRTFTSAQLASRLSMVDVKGSARNLGLTLSGATATDRLAALRTMKANTTSDPGILAGDDAVLQGIEQPLIGSQYEAQIISPSWLVDSAGLNPGATVNSSILDQVSPLRSMDPHRSTQRDRVTAKTLSTHGVCDFDSSDGVGNPDIQGVAKWFADANIGIYGNNALRQQPGNAKASDQDLAAKRADLIYNHLIVESYKGIALHEVGHALGMLHNFASSYDAVNFNPQYWQLRTNEGKSSDSCNSMPRANEIDTCMGPRFLDPETDDELGQAGESRPGINYFGSTSTMEYQNERFFESVGMGQYDLMTMGALYGRVLETFDPDAGDGVKIADQANFSWLNFTQLTEDDLVNQTTAMGRGPQPMHYTELARQIHLYDPGRCRDATPAEKQTAEWRIVHGKVCATPPKDHAAWNDFIANTDPSAGGGGPKTQVASDAPAMAGQVRWPYRWGEDSDAYIHVNPSDAGADPYEVTQETIKKFDYQYPFTYFRRQRRDWDYLRIPSRTATTFFERLRSYHWVVARNNATLPSLAPDALDMLKATDDNVRANLLAASDMLDAISRALVMPQIGDFGNAAPELQLGTDARIYDVAQQGNTVGALFTLDASTARFVDPSYDTGAAAGGSWDYLHWLSHAGFDVEKDIAGWSLTDGRPTLAIIQRDTYIDGRHLYINFQTDLAQGLDRLVGGVLSADWDSVASYVPPATSSAPEQIHLADPTPTRPKGSYLLFPNLGYLQQLGTMIGGQLYSRLGTDLSLQNKLLMYLEGTVGVIDVPDAQKIKFTDPRSGFTYVARLYGPDTVDGRTFDSGIASRMLAHANKLQTLAYQVQVDAKGNPVLDQYGRPTLVLDSSGQPIPTSDDASSSGYSDYVGLLDATVEVCNRVGHGAGVSLSATGNGP
jgi:hypothetical protein